MAEDPIIEKLKHEIIGILLVALGIVLFLSLVSYHPLDPSFFSYTSSKVKDIHNWMGVVGSYVSGFLFQAFGFPSFLVPFVLGIFAFSFIFRWEWKVPLIKLAGWGVLLLSTSSLFSLWLKPLRFYQQDILAGGFVGEIVSRILVRYFNVAGATILSLLALILSFVLGTGLSFISLVRRVGTSGGGACRKDQTFKMVRKEQAKRAKEVAKQKQALKAVKEVSTPVVAEKPAPSVKPEPIVEQEAFEFLKPKGTFSCPRSRSWKPRWKRGRRSIGKA